MLIVTSCSISEFSVRPWAGRPATGSPIITEDRTHALSRLRDGGEPAERADLDGRSVRYVASRTVLKRPGRSGSLACPDLCTTYSTRENPARFHSSTPC